MGLERVSSSIREAYDGRGLDRICLEKGDETCQNTPFVINAVALSSNASMRYCCGPGDQ